MRRRQRSAQHFGRGMRHKKRAAPATVTDETHPRVGAWREPDLWSRYWLATQQPLYCFLFLLPLVATYEFAALLVRPVQDKELLAHVMLQYMFALFGTTVGWLPGVALLLILLTWQVLGRFRWEVNLLFLPGMLLESILGAIPLLVLGQVFRSAPFAMANIAGEAWLAIGAGVYEELVFRLVLVTGLLYLMREVFKAPPLAAVATAVGVSALVFAACHFAPIGKLDFSWLLLAHFTLAGVYLALVFLGRGLGVATGAHAAYNICLALF